MESLPDSCVIDARGLLREIGNGFQTRGWQDSSDLALRITQQAQTTRKLDATAAATLTDQRFLRDNNTSIAAVEGVLLAVFDKRTLLDPDLDHPVMSAGAHQTNITVGDNNSGVVLNVGGQQQIVTVTSSTTDVLAAVEQVLREGFEGAISTSRFTELDELVSTRTDIGQQELEAAAQRAIGASKPSQSKIAQVRNAIMTSAASGLLVQAVMAVISLL